MEEGMGKHGLGQNLTAGYPTPTLNAIPLGERV